MFSMNTNDYGNEVGYINTEYTSKTCLPQWMNIKLIWREMWFALFKKDNTFFDFEIFKQ